MQVACIGLGNIGSGVATNLIGAGHEVCVADLDPAKVQALVDRGAVAAPDAAAAAVDAEVIVTSLPGPKQIRHVGSEILPAMAQGATWIEMSTNDLATLHELSAKANDAGVSLIDAPVSGGPEGAAAGTLSIFVGGDSKAVERVLPLLHAVGKKVDHLGPSGAGIVAKIAQVTLCYTQTVTLIEALLLGVKGGVEPAKMLDLIQNSAGTSYCADVYGPEILAGTYDPSFPISHAAKDMRLAMEMASIVGADLPFTERVAELYAETEVEFGPAAPHCLAAQLVERRNDLILHQHEPTEEPSS